MHINLLYLYNFKKTRLVINESSSEFQVVFSAPAGRDILPAAQDASDQQHSDNLDRDIAAFFPAAFERDSVRERERPVLVKFKCKASLVLAVAGVHAVPRRADQPADQLGDNQRLRAGAV